MGTSAILSSDIEVRSRLAQFGIVKQELIDVALAAISARNEYIEALDPRGAAGWFSYSYGTRALRRLLLSKGWRSDRYGQIEGAVHDELSIKFVFQNTVTACEEEIPRALSGKGSAASEQVSEGIYHQFGLFPDSYDDLPNTQDPKAVLWFLCVALHGDYPVAELLCPRAIKDKQFYGYMERIFILQPRDFLPLDLNDNNSGDGPDIDVVVTKKTK